MTTQNSSPVAILLAALPSYREGAPNDAIALERAARDKIEGAKQLSRERLYEMHVHPALAKLAEQKLLTASKAGHLRQPLPTLASAMRSGGKVEAAKLPQLDVSKFEGPNKFIKLMAYARKQSDRPLSHEEAHAAAAQLNRTHDVIA